MLTTAAWLALACSAGVAWAGAPPRASVILISIDTLRADHLSAYGYRAIRTPNIDALAERGTLFSNIDCQIPLTLPSHTSLFTSTYPFQNGVEENAEVVPAGMTTLASVLKAQGYATAAFIGSVFLESELGLNQGFDFYDSPFHFAGLSPLAGSMFFGGVARNPYSVRDRRDGALVIRAALQWMSAHRTQPAFVFVHLYDLHKPYKLPPKPSGAGPRPAPRQSSRQVGDLPHPGVSDYDTVLEHIDQMIGGFRKALVAGGWWDRSLVVFLSDHGESLGDHGEASHGYFIYQSTLWTPLIFHWPSGAPAYPPRVDHPAGLIDVAPTILDFLHVAAPASFEGTTLFGAPRLVYGESLHAHDSFGWSPLRSVRAGPYKYIEAPRPELYNLHDDPREQHNLAGANAAKAQELRGQMAKLVARYASRRPPASQNISPQTRALLGSLGYLTAGPSRKLAISGPDPKDRLAEFQEYEKATVLLYDGRTDQAIAVLSDLLSRDPRNALARRDLGGAYLAMRKYAEARSSFETIVADYAGDYMTQYELGLADERLGLLKEAREHLEAACRLSENADQCRRELAAVDEKLK
jgi:arylsulfatase A-like enzyme